MPLQVSPGGGSLTNDISVEGKYGKGGIISVYFPCWNSILGVGITLTSDNCLISFCCTLQELEGTLDYQRKLLGSWDSHIFLHGVKVVMRSSRTYSDGREVA